MYGVNAARFKDLLMAAHNKFGLSIVFKMIVVAKEHFSIPLTNELASFINENYSSSSEVLSTKLAYCLQELIDGNDPYLVSELKEFVYNHEIKGVEIKEKKHLTWVRQKTGLTPLKMVLSGDVRIEPYINLVLDNVLKNTKKTPLELLELCSDWIKPYVLAKV